jgi:TRAP-type mannitol/chloroaromatic compound transport system substrate-binding protein
MLRAAFATAVSALFLCFPAYAQTPKSVKVQSTWPASITLQDHLRILAERIDKLTQGSVKVETLAAGQIVPPFEVLDATNKKVLDGFHAIAYYWVGKNPAAALFAGPPGGPFGMDHMDFLGWLYVGGGLEMWRDFYQNDLKLNVTPSGRRTPRARRRSAGSRSRLREWLTSRA